jgi:hypothetical protein
MALSRQMSGTDYAASLKGYHFLTREENLQLFSGKPSPLAQRMQTLADFMLDRQLLSAPVPVGDITDIGPLQRIPLQPDSPKVASNAF